MPAANPAWVAVQIAELLRSAEDRLLEGITALGPGAHAGIAEDADITLELEATRRLKESIAEAADLVEQLALLAERVPAGTIAIDYDGVRDGAATDLADGIIDRGRALLAARVLDVPSGWAALAEALTSTDAHLGWEDTTLAEMLGRCRGADRQLVGRAIAEAGLSPDLAFTVCSPERLARLAAVLRSHPGSAPR